RIRVVITKVEKTTKGPQVMVSRTDPVLVQHLFQTEVPEIYDGTVQIKSTAREAGERTKIAVASREKDVDPVGACVGMKGTRVQSIIRELRGEKIDNIPGLTASLVQKLNAAGIGTVEQLANLSPEELENIQGIGEKTIEKISDALSEYYTQSPAYQDQMERLAQQHMFSKDVPAPEPANEPAEEPAEAEEPAPRGEETGEQNVPEE